MEQAKFADTLRATTEENQRMQMEAEIQAEREEREREDERTRAYVEGHKQLFIDELAQNAQSAATHIRTQACVSRHEDSLNREGLYQTMREVRDYYRSEGFKAGMDTGDNARALSNEEWDEATHCWAKVTIDWSHH